MSSRKHAYKIDAVAISAARHRKEFDRITDVAEDKIADIFFDKGLKREQRNAIPFGLFVEKLLDIDLKGLDKVSKILIDYHRQIGKLNSKYFKKIGID